MGLSTIHASVLDEKYHIRWFVLITTKSKEPINRQTVLYLYLYLYLYVGSSKILTTMVIDRYRAKCRVRLTMTYQLHNGHAFNIFFSWNEETAARS